MAARDYDPCPAGEEGVLDLGSQVRVRFTHDGDGQRVGLIESHPHPAGGRCSGAVIFDVPANERFAPERPRWTVESEDPLTLSPSLLCACGHHGFIREGKWVSA